MVRVENKDCNDFLQTIDDGVVDLILTDPPYIISRDSGMEKHYNNILNSTSLKTTKEWKTYMVENGDEIKKLIKPFTRYTLENFKDNYIKYGSIYGKKYAVKTDYGDWDSGFKMEKLKETVSNYYKKLRKGGTVIIFFDIWKITDLKKILEDCKFKQIRMIEWIKTNPQPRNSKINYLTNAREIALLAVKGGKPTFNTKYHNGIFEYPIANKNRTHPTQKNIDLIKELITIHSNEGDTVVDTFLGSGTTMFACKDLNRVFMGCELNEEYYNTIMNRLIAT